MAIGDSTHRDASACFEMLIEDERGDAVDVAKLINPDEAKHEVGGERAAEHGIPVVGAYEDFNGPDGGGDAVAAGLLGDDQLQPTRLGARRLAEMLAAYGDEPS